MAIKSNATNSELAAMPAESIADLRSPVHVVDFRQVEPTKCPCGWARRGFLEDDRVPFSMHVTEISEDAKLHYHKNLTETYFVLECQPEAKLQLDDQLLDLHPGMAVLIPPGVRHRAVGSMRVLIVVDPKFDPQDEWFDE